MQMSIVDGKCTALSRTTNQHEAVCAIDAHQQLCVREHASMACYEYNLKFGYSVTAVHSHLICAYRLTLCAILGAHLLRLCRGARQHSS